MGVPFATCLLRSTLVNVLLRSPAVLSEKTGQTRDEDDGLTVVRPAYRNRFLHEQEFSGIDRPVRNNVTLLLQPNFHVDRSSEVASAEARSRLEIDASLEECGPVVLSPPSLYNPCPAESHQFQIRIKGENMDSPAACNGRDGIGMSTCDS